MARRLRDKYNKPRRKKNRGRLDTRKTIRRNASWGGIPFITVWKQKRIDKPKIVALCDVSGSVARVAEFLLLFLYSLNEAISDIHTYAFSGRLVDVSEILDNNAIDKAMQEVMKTVGYGSSDYGKSFHDFDDNFMSGVTNRTTVIILGDGRNNNLDPRTDILRSISERARRVIWLNPEPRFAWGTGDSEMPRYHLLHLRPPLRHRPPARARGVGYRGELSVSGGHSPCATVRLRQASRRPICLPSCAGLPSTARGKRCAAPAAFP